MARTIDLHAILEKLGPACAAGAAERDESDGFVDDNYARLKQHGVFAALVPADLGGGGASHGAMCAFLKGLAHYCPSTALALSMHSHLVAAAVYNHRNGRPGKALLEKVAAGAVLVSTGANDWLESSGTVERVDGGFRVSAVKPFGSGSPVAAAIVTSAPYHDPDHGWQVLHFPVPFSAEGVSLANDWKTLGMRATGSHTIVLERVFVPDDAIALRRPRGQFHMVWSVVLTVAMPLIMSVYTGVAEKAAEIARSLAARRSDDPAAPYLLGELANLLTTAQLAQADMVRLANDFDFQATVDIANAMLVRKTICANAVIATTQKALETAGGAGFFRKAGLERLVRDAQGARFHPLPEKRQQQFTGRLALGLDPVGETADVGLKAAAE
jgi:alkylation response protein AidB-like acyl-CoA dehydrogenase